MCLLSEVLLCSVLVKCKVLFKGVDKFQCLGVLLAIGFYALSQQTPEMGNLAVITLERLNIWGCFNTPKHLLVYGQVIMS